jgi:hypothetical protein
MSMVVLDGNIRESVLLHQGQPLRCDNLAGEGACERAIGIGTNQKVGKVRLKLKEK